MNFENGKENKMKVFFINPSFKAKYGKFSRENRSPTVTRSGTLYYPLWLIYAAATCEKDGFEVEFLDAPAKPMTEKESHFKDNSCFLIRPQLAIVAHWPYQPLTVAIVIAIAFAIHNAVFFC